MTRSSFAALIAAASLTVFLAACGGSGSSDSSSDSTATSTPPAQTETTGTAPVVQGLALTPPGTKLPLGKEAVVGWVPPGTYGKPGDREGIKLKVAVEAIEEASIDDFDEVGLEPDQEKSTPYYVKLKLESLGEGEDPSIAGIDEPDLSFAAIDDRGQEQGSITFLGDFPPCEDTTPPDSFDAGASYESCLSYLMPGGGSIDSIVWNNGPAKEQEVTPYFSEPIVWSGS